MPVIQLGEITREYNIWAKWLANQIGLDDPFLIELGLKKIYNLLGPWSMFSLFQWMGPYNQ